MAKKKEPKEKTPIPKNLDQLREICNKKYGQGAVVMGADAVVDVDIFPCGIASVDRALGCGGIPQGRVIEVYGAESSGKTTFCLHTIASCQSFYFQGRKNRNGVAAFIDAEHAVDPVWARLLGVNWDNLLFSQPSCGEDSLNTVEIMASSGLVDLIVVDSVASLVPKAELAGEIGDHHVGAQARMMSQGLRKMEGICAKNLCTVIFINQIREKVGVMFGSPETTPGGRALKFYSSIRMEISKGGKLTNDDKEVCGFNPKLKIVKTKVGGQPFAEAFYNIHSGDPISGIDKVASLVDVGLDAGILTQKGSFVSFNGKSLGNGKSKVYECIRNDDKLELEIRNKIYDGLYAKIEAKRLKSENMASKSASPVSVASDTVTPGISETIKGLDDDD